MAAEEARAAVGAASLSVSRWEREGGALRTIINVGELGPGEERYPDERDLPAGRGSRRPIGCCATGVAYFNAVDATGVDPWIAARLRAARQGVRGRRADHGRGGGLGRGLRDHRARPAALPRRGRALPRGRGRPAGRGDRARRAVLARVAARLRGLAHRAGQPSRGGGAPRARRQRARPSATARWRCCSATSTSSRRSTTSPGTTPATAPCAAWPTRSWPRRPPGPAAWSAAWPATSSA